MKLELSIASYKGAEPDAAAVHVFTEQGGTLGRSPSNSMILRDPEQFISRTHARIEWRRNAFYVAILGKNPAEVNGRVMEQGDEAMLDDGDELVIGDYSLAARIVEAENAFEPLPEVAYRKPIRDDVEEARLSEPILPGNNTTSVFGVSLFGGGITDTKKRINGSSPLASLTTANHLPVINEPVPPIRIQRTGANVSLDNWDPFASAVEECPGSRQREGPSLAVGTHVAQSPRNTFLDEHVATLDDTRDAEPTTQSRSNANAEGLLSLLRAAGIPDIQAQAVDNPETMAAVGEVLKETIEGLHRVLRGRAVTKREMRVDQTMMEASGNNPLKFTPDPKDALRYLIAPRTDAGFMPPVKAVREAFDDIQAHNLAVLAGVRAALHAVFLRFEPRQIEGRFKAQGFLDKVLPSHRKARMWDLMTELHAVTVKEAQDDFEQLFGQVFARAYQEEMLTFRSGAKQLNTR